jgi:hypothetical protein
MVLPRPDQSLGCLLSIQRCHGCTWPNAIPLQTKNRSMYTHNDTAHVTTIHPTRFNKFTPSKSLMNWTDMNCITITMTLLSYDQFKWHQIGHQDEKKTQCVNCKQTLLLLHLVLELVSQHWSKSGGPIAADTSSIGKVLGSTLSQYTLFLN